MGFQGGVGDDSLDFRGDLRRQASGRLGASMSSSALIVPQDMDVESAVEGALADVDVQQGFARRGVSTSTGGPDRL